ncbi:MAG: DUF3977 family protein [Bacilli bacterium]
MVEPIIFTEVGLDFDNNKYGLGVSTEIEYSNYEERKKGFVKINVKEVYLRVWILKSVFILSKKEGMKFNKKNRSNLKIVIGLSDKEF